MQGGECGDRTLTLFDFAEYANSYPAWHGACCPHGLPSMALLNPLSAEHCSQPAWPWVTTPYPLSQCMHVLNEPWAFVVPSMPLPQVVHALSVEPSLAPVK